jgi:glycosyltransferase involved in cell wall biosynthesis
MGTPEISVVMSVFNGAGYLRRSVESILTQEGPDFEFIIVDDGSTDGSGEILAEYASGDKRICIIGQENTGLTRALIRGCAMAKGIFIARHDAGDYSLPGRLAAQRDFLDSDSGSVIAVSGVRQSLPDRRIVGEIWPVLDRSQMQKAWSEAAMGIPAHGCVMFRRDAYLASGGYRPAFYYAQDRDLWLRINRLGSLGCIRKVLYELNFDIESISASRNCLQSKFSDLAEQCFDARNSGKSEEKLLEKASRLIANAERARKQSRGKYEKAGTYYRLASTLERSAPEMAREFYRLSLQICPYYWRTWRKAFRLLGGQP